MLDLNVHEMACAMHVKMDGLGKIVNVLDIVWIIYVITKANVIVVSLIGTGQTAI